MNAIKSLSILILLIQCSCASTMKSKILTAATIGGAAGAVYGHSLDSHKDTHAAMYGGLSALTSAILMLIYVDPDKEVEKLREQNRELVKSISQGEKIFSEKQSSKVGPLINNYQQIPKEYRSRINAGQWKLSEIDEVEQIDENTLVRKTEVLEIIPPEIKN